jgi:hypothetical protein
MISLQMAEALGTVHTHRMRLLGGCWWLVGPKLVLDQMAAPVPEIMDDSLYETPPVFCFIPFKKRYNIYFGCVSVSWLFSVDGRKE